VKRLPFVVFLSFLFLGQNVFFAYEEDDDRPRTRAGGISHLLLMGTPGPPPTAFLPPGASGSEHQAICPCCGVPYAAPNIGGGGPGQPGAPGQGGAPYAPYTDKYAGNYASDGSVPPGAALVQNGTAHIDYDGSSVVVNDPWRQAGNSAGVDGAVVPFVVQNRNANGGWTYPQGTRVLAVNNTNGRSSWGIIGDNGPTNAGRNEMSPAMADNLGVTIRDSADNYVNSTSGDNITYYFYPNSR